MLTDSLPAFEAPHHVVGDAEVLQVGRGAGCSLEEEGFEMGGKMRLMKEGGLVGGQKRLDKNNDGRLSREDFELLRAMFGAKLPR